MADTITEKAETTSVPSAQRQCPCFQERKSPIFTLDTLLPLASDFIDDGLIPTVIIPVNGTKFIYYATNMNSSNLYYLNHTEKKESIQK